MIDDILLFFNNKFRDCERIAALSQYLPEVKR